MKAHSWSDARQVNINPMLWVTPAWEMPRTAAARVAPLLAAKPAGDRVLIFHPAFPVIPKDDPAKLVACGLPLVDRMPWYRDFFWGLHQANAPRIDLIVLDEEDGISVWHWPSSPDANRAIYADPVAVAALPARLRGLGPVLSEPGIHRAEFIAWNRSMTIQYHEAIEAAILDTASNAIGYRPRMSQYGAHLFAFDNGTSTDRNGWPLWTAPVGDVSGPVLYPNGTGALFAALPESERKAADLALCLRVAAACAPPVIPWVPFPSYVGFEIFRALIDGLTALGIEEVLAWNPTDAGHTTPEDNEFASEVFE